MVFPRTARTKNVPPVFKKDKMKDPGKYGLVGLKSVHIDVGKNTSQNISKHIEGQEGDKSKLAWI